MADPTPANEKENAMTEQEAVADAARGLYERMGDSSEDVLEEAYAAMWPEGEEHWYEHGIYDEAGAEEHRERVFCLVMADLARRCQQRAEGQVPTDA